LLREAFGDLLELDSRVWRTLGPLLLRPGLLTKDYLEGRRARYMPPFRTYLVLSIVFFVVAFFDPSEKFGLLLPPAPQPGAEEIAQPKANAPVARSGGEIELADENANSICRINDDDWDNAPDWLVERLTPASANELCERALRDNGKYFVGLLLDNIPIALVVLLPLMALFLKTLYPLSRRFFVEHLLFFVHFHAFFFLILTLQVIFQRIMSVVPVPGAIPILAIVAASLYIPVYLYMAMHHVYGQGRLLTLMKYVMLFLDYFIGASLTLLGAVFFALLSV
jgi:hypothetical protein